MRVEVLTIPGCPNGPLLIERLGVALAGLPQVQVTHRVISTEADAARAGLHGSPTLLIDGEDPFAGPDTPASLSCRLYQHSARPADGAPSVAELRRVLTGQA